MLARHDPEQLLDTALNALSTNCEWKLLLDELPVPIYTTDADGSLVYWNRACIDFAGREPQLGRDRWCITWKIYTTTGDPMPHDKCPMADAIREQRAIRDVVAIAERPDGSRRAFRPYPTPIFDQEGSVTGALNMLVDVTEEQREVFTIQADRCRRLADSVYNRETCSALEEMASKFERAAARLRSKPSS